MVSPIRYRAVLEVVTGVIMETPPAGSSASNVVCVAALVPSSVPVPVAVPSVPVPVDFVWPPVFKFVVVTFAVVLVAVVPVSLAVSVADVVVPVSLAAEFGQS